MWRRLLRVKAILLLMAGVEFVGGCHAAHFPGRSAYQMDGAGFTIENALAVGPVGSYPLRASIPGFFLFAAAAAVGAAWVQAAEVRARGLARGAGRRTAGVDYELVDE